MVVDNFDQVRAALREARLDAGLSCARLAARIGFSDRAIVSWENGWRTPARANAEKWAAALGVEIPYRPDWYYRQTRNQVAPCGTRSGYQRHMDRIRAGNWDEEVCEPCRIATNEYYRDIRARRAQERRERRERLAD